MTGIERLTSISNRLSVDSEKNYSNPYTTIQWPDTLPADALCFSPELISISALPEFQNLSKDELRKLSLMEAVNFFSLNISGERELISGLSTRLYKKYPKAITDYIHHFLDEENKHMIWFGTFSKKYGGKVYPDKKVVFPKEYQKGEKDFLFFAKIVIFEMIVDHYNIEMAKDESLTPLARQIHQQHHDDESRHLGFGREITSYLYNEYKDQWSEGTRDNISEYLKEYFLSTWREYYNPTVYADCGLENSYDLRTAAWESKTEFRQMVSRKCIGYFQKNEIIQGDILI